MRIIAGKYRRRKLQTSPGETTRPITDRVKERLFENISQRLEGKRVADIFAGTGTIGLESLSRGASNVTFLERDRVALELLKENVAMLGCEAETLIWPADILKCSFKPKGTNSDGFAPFDVIFFDPPYKMVAGIQPGRPLFQVLQRLAREDVSNPEATLILRTPRKVDYVLPEPWQIDWTLEMSGMVIQVCTARPNGADVEEATAEEQDDEKPTSASE